MLGIDDPLVLAAFLGSIAITVASLIYGILRRNAAIHEVTREDRAWAIQEQKVEDEL
jgi:hypothetical protein